MLLRGKISLAQGYSVQRISKKAFEADSMSLSQCPKKWINHIPNFPHLYIVLDIDVGL